MRSRNWLNPSETHCSVRVVFVTVFGPAWGVYSPRICGKADSASCQTRQIMAYHVLRLTCVRLESRSCAAPSGRKHCVRAQPAQALTPARGWPKLVSHCKRHGPCFTDSAATWGCKTSPIASLFAARLDVQRLGCNSGCGRR